MDNNFNNENVDLNKSQETNEFNGGNFNYTPQPEQPQKDPGHGLAIASLVLGILSILSCCCTYLAVILGVVGIVLAIISKSKSLTGKMETMALIGMILSILGVVIAVAMIIWSLAFSQTPAYQEMMNQYMDMYGSY
jgi:hypothetical protein